ncbi:alginate lyase family protein [Ancylobacter oerskovii]|uniref:Alginate lyase family protein n=1 Tax=Ancylobacter oerskovii TaxID=459519 RepID=A0ABW4Z5E0_9HYPH|nr:alginate lyase family protein [Ancylobacter oerskovii]MBS7543219.1 alginate lyase family protein [Ancylobacter oerskovii]
MLKIRHCVGKVILFICAVFIVHASANAQEDQACPNVGPPIKNINALSYYDRMDPTRSQIVEERRDKNIRLTEGVTRFQKVIVGLANDNTRFKKECAIQIMKAWALADALEGSKNRGQADKVRIWVLGSISISYLKLYDIVESDDKEIIDNWIRDLASITIKYTESRKKMTNIGYWGVFGVGAAAIAINDMRMWYWAEEMYNNALNDIESDGTLAAERGRGERAFLYHVFAAQPLVGFEFIRSFVRCDQKIPNKLLSLTSMLEKEFNGSGYIAQLSGYRQLDVSRPPWLVLLERPQSDQLIAEKAKDSGPVRLGGSLLKLTDSLTRKYDTCNVSGTVH